jgi:hypothetical protein
MIDGLLLAFGILAAFLVLTALFDLFIGRRG